MCTLPIDAFSFSFKLRFLPSILDHLPLRLPLLGRWEVTKGSAAWRSETSGSWEQQPVGVWAVKCHRPFPSSGKQHLGHALVPARPSSPCPPSPPASPNSTLDQQSRRGCPIKVLRGWLPLSSSPHCHGEGTCLIFPCSSGDASYLDFMGSHQFPKNWKQMQVFEIHCASERKCLCGPRGRTSGFRETQQVFFSWPPPWGLPQTPQLLFLDISYVPGTFLCEHMAGRAQINACPQLATFTEEWTNKYIKWIRKLYSTWEVL